MADVRDPFIRQMVEKAVLLGKSKTEIDEQIDQIQAMAAPRWSVSPEWITFDCGCTGERCSQLFGHEAWDPVIFAGTEHQAVYEKVCTFHEASMNARLKFGGFVDFRQWSERRRRQIMGKVL